MNLLAKSKLAIAKRLLKDSYIKYSKFKSSVDCGEELLLYMSETACLLRRDLEENHLRCKRMDKNCPDMKYLIISEWNV